MTQEPFYESAGSEHIKKERQKARDLRGSSWWKQQLANGVCAYCEKRFSPDQLTMDHKIPIARGGRSNKGNLVVACKNCNNEKKHLTPVEMVLRKN